MSTAPVEVYADNALEAARKVGRPVYIAQSRRTTR
jgi:hypothetical protein